MQKAKNESSLGLSSKEAERSRERYGSNRLESKRGKSFLRCFFENLSDPVIRILLGALIINLFFVFRGGDMIETLGIGISVLLATLISTFSERGSEAAFARLEAEFSLGLFRVWRDGRLVELSIDDIVVGDLVSIGAGEQIPADSFVINGRVSIDQSMLTGESREVEKCKSRDTTKTPSSKSAVFRGSAVLSGEAVLQVFAVGEESLFGRISDEVGEETRQSPLKLRLTKLARQISRIGYLAAVLVALAYLFNTFVIDSGFSYALMLGKLKNLSYALEHLLHALMLGLTVIVMAVPEGLPMMIAVVLSSNIRRMTRDNVLVRKPVGIESAGSMNILFTDKTGTLTEGKMSVGRIICASRNGVGEYSDVRTLKKASPTLARLYLENAIYNTSASLSGKDAIGGNSTERALLLSVRELAAEAQEFSVNARLPFDSAIKLSAVSLGERVLVKGAPERLIPFCRLAYTEDGSTRSFSSVSGGILKRISEITSSGGRVLCIAQGNTMPSSEHLGELRFIAAVFLSDKLREEACDSVSTLEGAGIQVVMITGDAKETAEHIARECGILSKKRPLVLDSDSLSRMSDTELKEALPNMSVLARALPTDKSRLVRISQESGLVVGMTGDGINDAPALKRADVGFAMGNGSAVAREAGDVIILDNNLSSIAKAVLYGRTVFKSIRKFITLQLTMNFCAVGISMIGPFIGYDSPVTVVQMLWINIIMDTLGGLAFAGEAPLPSYMKERPKRRDEPILNGYMAGQIAFSGCATVALYLAFLLSPTIVSRFRYSPNKIYLLTAFFALFIFTSVLHCFNSRTDRLNLFSGLCKNRAFISIIALVSIIQIGFIFLGGSMLRTAPLSKEELIFTLLLALAVIPIEFARKLFLRLIGKKRGF